MNESTLQEIIERHDAGVGNEPHTKEAVEQWIHCCEIHDDRETLLEIILFCGIERQGTGVGK